MISLKCFYVWNSWVCMHLCSDCFLSFLFIEFCCICDILSVIYTEFQSFYDLTKLSPKSMLGAFNKQKKSFSICLLHFTYTKFAWNLNFCAMLHVIANFMRPGGYYFETFFYSVNGATKHACMYICTKK